MSSPLLRSLETAEVFGRELRIPVEVDARLRERDNWGDVPGEPRDVRRTLEAM